MKISINKDMVGHLIRGRVEGCIIITVKGDKKVTKMRVLKDRRRLYVGKAAVFNSSNGLLAGNFDSLGQAVSWVRVFVKNNPQWFE